MTNDDKTAVEFLNRYSWDCIIKPINSGYFTNNDKVYHIYTNATVKEKINLSILHKCPAFFQQRIEKSFDVRTVYVNGNTIYVRILGGGLDVRRNEMEGLKYDLVEPPDDVAFAYNKLIDSYSLRFCTSDFVVTGENKWVFLENNPNGQWVWMDEQLHGELRTFFYNNLRNIREYE